MLHRIEKRGAWRDIYTGLQATLRAGRNCCARSSPLQIACWYSNPVSSLKNDGAQGVHCRGTEKWKWHHVAVRYSEIVFTYKAEKLNCAPCDAMSGRGADLSLYAQRINLCKPYNHREVRNHIRYEQVSSNGWRWPEYHEEHTRVQVSTQL